MLNEKFIKEKIGLILRDLERLEELRGMTFNEVAKDAFKYAALKNFLMEIIGRAIDINGHLIAEFLKPGMSSPRDYRETFLILGELGILPKNFVKKISDSAGFRNAIVHEYNSLDKGIVYKTIDEAIDQYAEYCDYILNYLTREK